MTNMTLYHIIKSFVPLAVRRFLRPYYVKYGTRRFSQPVMVRVKDGGVMFDMKIDPQNGAVDEYVFMHRHWESHIGAVLRQYLKEGSVFIDVGANIGYFSLYAAKLVGHTGQIIAFEPIPRLCAQIKESCVVNGFQNLAIKNFALGSSEQVLQLGVYHQNIGGSSLGATQAQEYIDVTVKVLDNELRHLPRVDCIKIDVEGYEYGVLDGARNTLKKFRPVVILEFSPSIYHVQSPTMAEDILQLLEKNGYSFIVLQTNELYVNARSILSNIDTMQVDLLCVPTGQV